MSRKAARLERPSDADIDRSTKLVPAMRETALYPAVKAFLEKQGSALAARCNVKGLA